MELKHKDLKTVKVPRIGIDSCHPTPRDSSIDSGAGSEISAAWECSQSLEEMNLERIVSDSPKLAGRCLENYYVYEK